MEPMEVIVEVLLWELGWVELAEVVTEELVLASVFAVFVAVMLKE